MIKRSGLGENGEPAELRYASAGTVLGRLLVAGSPAGLGWVALGDSDAELLEGLRTEHPRARLVADGLGLGGWVEALVGHLEGDRVELDLPLDVPATAFQARVWAELRRIPHGETRTYTELAGRLGRPDAVRAVAGACAANRLALVIPCHRVVRADGGLGGYRWGIARKAALIDRERAARHGRAGPEGAAAAGGSSSRTGGGGRIPSQRQEGLPNLV